MICFQVSKIKARQEVTKLLREWKKYGVRNIQIDKHRNIVFGSVAAKNCQSFAYLLTWPPANIS